MNRTSETPAKKMMIGDGIVLSYEVKVNYKDGLDKTKTNYPEGQVADSIKITVKQMELNGSTWKVMPSQPKWATDASDTITHKLDAIGTPTPVPVVNLNSSRVGLLATLEYIGPKRAQEIDEYREEQRKKNSSAKVFNSIDDLEKVPSISNGILELIKNANSEKDYEF